MFFNANHFFLSVVRGDPNLKLKTYFLLILANIKILIRQSYPLIILLKNVLLNMPLLGRQSMYVGMKMVVTYFRLPPYLVHTLWLLKKLPVLKYLLSMYICMYMYVHVCTFVCTFVCTCMYICMYIYVHLYVHVCTFVCTCMYICMYIYVHLYVHICTFVCT
jgi:nuclear pore complex protein Nup62